MKKAAILFSGGKDSCYSAYVAKEKGYDIKCLITVVSDNIDSYMFHTPSIDKTKEQAKVMDIPLVTHKTKGIKEEELKDLEDAVKKAIKKYKIDTIVTGAIASNYQAQRIKEICTKLKLNCYNPLWEKDELNYLHELVKNKFKVIITGVAAFPLDKSWIGRIIDNKFIHDSIELNNKYQIHIAGEGGEFETFVLNCPLFKRELKVIDKKISGKQNSWRMDIKVE